MKGSPTAIIPATRPCLGPKVCCWTSSLTACKCWPPSPICWYPYFFFYFILSSFYLLQVLGEVELRATLSSRPRYSPISSPTRSTSLQNGVNSYKQQNCTHMSLFLLTGCGDSPYPPRHVPGLTPQTAGLSGALCVFNKPDLWKTCVFVYRCVMEGHCSGSLNPRPNAAPCFSCCCRQWCPLSFRGLGGGQVQAYIQLQGP